MQLPVLVPIEHRGELVALVSTRRTHIVSPRLLAAPTGDTDLLFVALMCACCARGPRWPYPWALHQCAGARLGTSCARRLNAEDRVDPRHHIQRPMRRRPRAAAGRCRSRRPARRASDRVRRQRVVQSSTSGLPGRVRSARMWPRSAQLCARATPGRRFLPRAVNGSCSRALGRHCCEVALGGACLVPGVHARAYTTGSYLLVELVHGGRAR
jgi:hypothetical protein